MDISGPSPRIFAQPNNMSQPGCRTVGEMEASKISEIVLLYWRCVINLWFSCRFRTVCTRAYRTFGIMWVGCESNSNPLFQGMGPVLRDVFLWVLNEKPCRCAVAPAEALLNTTTGSNWSRTDSGLDLAIDDKGTPHAVGDSSSLVGARTATWVPGCTLGNECLVPCEKVKFPVLGIGFCYVLELNLHPSTLLLWYVGPRVSVTCQVGISEDRLHKDCKEKDPEG